MDRERLALIVGRLRNPTAIEHVNTRINMILAADAIESLVAEVDRLRGQRQPLLDMLAAARQVDAIRSGVVVHRPGGVDVFAADHGDGE